MKVLSIDTQADESGHLLYFYYVRDDSLECSAFSSQSVICVILSSRIPDIFVGDTVYPLIIHSFGENRIYSFKKLYL